MKEILINNMAKDLCRLDRPCEGCPNRSTCKARLYARRAVAKGYRNGAEVASKIFDEIRREIRLALESNYNAKRERVLRFGAINATDIPLYLIDGKIAALRGVDEYLEHIEQKYKVE